jgi:hypothetical protein
MRAEVEIGWSIPLLRILKRDLKTPVVVYPH